MAATLRIYSSCEWKRGGCARFRKASRETPPYLRSFAGTFYLLRPPVDTIVAPPFPAGLEWVNVATLRMDQQAGRPVLIEFWDFCRPNSLRTLPYAQAWAGRHGPEGLRVIGVHSPGFEPSRDNAAAG